LVLNKNLIILIKPINKVTLTKNPKIKINEFRYKRSEKIKLSRQSQTIFVRLNKLFIINQVGDKILNAKVKIKIIKIEAKIIIEKKNKLVLNFSLIPEIIIILLA